MRKVITGSLNGNAYQFEEEAFEMVRNYLDRATRQSAESADRAEVMQDLEQAIADKCDSFLGKHKNVVLVDEARRMLREMGPVDVEAERPAATGSPDPVPPRPQSAYRTAPPRRQLYRLPYEGMLGGVCAGLAAYVGIDVVWVRVAYVLLAFTTGFWIVVWLAQLLITPKAVTREQIAAAQGLNGAYGH